MLRVSFALSVLMVFAAIGTEPVLAQPAPQTSNQVFGNLNSLVRAIPFSRQSWEEELAELGLRGESGSGEQWTLRDGRGEVRAWAFFLDDETTFFLLFFRRIRRPFRTRCCPICWVWQHELRWMTETR